MDICTVLLPDSKSCGVGVDQDRVWEMVTTRARRLHPHGDGHVDVEQQHPGPVGSRELRKSTVKANRSNVGQFVRSRLVTVTTSKTGVMSSERMMSNVRRTSR
jgi:hypothetical protein